MSSVAVEGRGEAGRTSSRREQHGQSPEFLGNGQGSSAVWLQHKVGSGIRLRISSMCHVQCFGLYSEGGENIKDF